MKLLLLLPLLALFKISEKATLCAVLFTCGVAGISLLSGHVIAYVIGEAVATIILSGLYFGFLKTLDESKWVWWVVLFAGGALLVLYG